MTEDLRQWFIQVISHNFFNDSKGNWRRLIKQLFKFVDIFLRKNRGRTCDKLPELVKTQVEAIKNLKIDKITVWDNMSSGKDGKSPTSANFLAGMLGSIPPFEELFKMAGMELPDYLKGKKTDEKAAAEAVDTKKDNRIEDTDIIEEEKE